MTTWQAFEEALQRTYDLGGEPVFWLRDDDASADNSQLRALLACTENHGVPLALAAIPAEIEASLQPLVENADVTILPHGFRHRNYAPETEKKAEFGLHRTVPDMLADIAIGWTKITAVFGKQALGIFVPPWNRMAPALVPFLCHAGLHGWSGFGRKHIAAPNSQVRQFNTHLDVVNWRGDRGFIGEPEALAALISLLDAATADAEFCDPAIGVLTHHKVMGDRTLNFLQQLFERTRTFATPGGRQPVRWLTAQQLLVR